MTIPRTNISAAKIRSDLYGSAGSFSPIDTIPRDAIRKPSGSVAYTDFGGTCWGQGRTLGKQQSGQTIYPYSLDSRADGSGPGGADFSVNIVGGLPEWSASLRVYSYMFSAGSTTGQSWFISDSTATHTLTFTGETANYQSAYPVFPIPGYYVVQFDAGYLSGNRTNLLVEQGMTLNDHVKTYSSTFNPTRTGAWIVPVFSLRHTGYDPSSSGLAQIDMKVRNARVTR